MLGNTRRTRPVAIAGDNKLKMKSGPTNVVCNQCPR